MKQNLKYALLSKFIKTNPLSNDTFGKEKYNNEEAIDDYLALCEEKGIEPEKAFKGSFHVRVGSQLHRQTALFAQQRGVNLNKLVTDALERYLKGELLENA